MFKPKGIVIDIDGTLTGEDRSLNCRAVMELRKVDYPVILATGNIVCYARAAAKLIGISEVVIAENGGVVRLEYDGDNIILGDKERCVEAMKFLEREMGNIEPLDLEYRLSEVALRRNFRLEDAQKVLIKSGFKVKLVDSQFAYHIMDERVSKGNALRYIGEKLEIDPEDFVAIGDSENDVDLLRVSGFGVAVGNAHPILKKVADYVCASDDGEGVIEALKYLKIL